MVEFGEGPTPQDTRVNKPAEEVIPPDPYAAPEGMSPVEVRMRAYAQQLGEEGEVEAQGRVLADLAALGGLIGYGLGTPPGGDVRSPRQWQKILDESK